MRRLRAKLPYTDSVHLLAAAAVAGTLLAATPPSRVVVLAFDGVDATLV
jgi:hypothetical protein